MWNERYREEGYAYGLEPNDFLAEQADRCARGKVLCLADGQGRNGVFLATLGCAVTSVDLSEVGLTQAAELAQAKGVTLKTIHADLTTWEAAPETFDAIVSIFAHFPPEARVKIHRSAARALKPGGYFLLEAYTPANIGRGTGGPRTADHTYTAKLLQEDFAGWEFLVLEEIERDIHEGKYHQGRSAVVRLVARKPVSGAS